MTPAFFLLICLGGIICLTPLAVYLFWLSGINRKRRPTVISAAWDFVATLVALGGFLFCIGVLLASAVMDLGLFTGGPFRRLAAWLPWLNLAWFVSISVYLLVLARAVRKGVAARRHSLSVFNIDETLLRETIEESLLMIDRAGDRKIVRVTTFPIFRHAVVSLDCDAAEVRSNLESQLRMMIPRLPAAAENPASPWITAASTCSMVCVGCCVVLIFALPFLR